MSAMKFDTGKDRKRRNGLGVCGGVVIEDCSLVHRDDVIRLML